MRRAMVVLVMAAASVVLATGMAADAKPKRTPRPTPAPTLRTAGSPMPIDRPAEVCLSVRAATANLTPGAFADAIARGAVIVTAVVPCPAVTPGPSSSPAPAVAPTPRATPRPLPTPVSVTKTGNGDSRTGPFALSGGDYRIDVAVRSEGGEFDAGCVHFGTLMSTDGSVREEGGDAEAGPNAASTGMTYVYGLPAGTYYFDISSLCRWTVTIRPA